MCGWLKKTPPLWLAGARLGPLASGRYQPAIAHQLQYCMLLSVNPKTCWHTRPLVMAATWCCLSRLLRSEQWLSGFVRAATYLWRGLRRKSLPSASAWSGFLLFGPLAPFMLFFESRVRYTYMLHSSPDGNVVWVRREDGLRRLVDALLVTN